MLFVVASLVISFFSFGIGQEKDYTLLDYSGLSASQTDKLKAAQKDIEWWCDKDYPGFHPNKHSNWILEWLNDSKNYSSDDFKMAIESKLSLFEMRQLDGRIFCSQDFLAYLLAAYGMEIAAIIKCMQFPSEITESQIQRLYKTGNKDVACMMASCRKHPEKKDTYIEEYKQQSRLQLVKKLVNSTKL